MDGQFQKLLARTVTDHWKKQEHAPMRGKLNTPIFQEYMLYSVTFRDWIIVMNPSGRIG